MNINELKSKNLKELMQIGSDYEDRKVPRDEFLLAATAQNLRKLAKLIPTPNLQPA